MSAADYFFWSNTKRNGECVEWAGPQNGHGYGTMRVHGTLKQAHRVAWEMTYGPIPAGVHIDHICFNRACVKIEHLRLATPKQNSEHRSGAQANNVQSGIRGVYWNRTKWQARLTHKGVIHTAGMFDDIRDAEAAIIALRNELFTHNDVDRRQ